MINILVVEDEKPIANLIKMSLTKAGYSCTCIYDGLAAADILEENPFDLVLLDIMLPGASGYDVLEYIKPLKIPVIFITAKNSLNDRVMGLKMGAEDYIVKPFSLATLYAKILAILRRTKQENQKETITCGKIRMDKQSCQVFVKEREVQLQNKQYEILRFLMEHKNIVWSRDALLNHIWGYDYIGVDRVVDNQIKKLRSALGEEGKRIQTVVGRGYKISDA